MPKGETAEISLETALELELAKLMQSNLIITALDETKCYDSVVREIALGAAKDLGCPSGIIDSQLRFYRNLLRTFKYQDSRGTFWLSQTSIAQGCALSQIWINVTVHFWAKLIELHVPQVRTSAFIDDRSLRTEKHDDMAEALDLTSTYDKLTGKESNPAKTHVGATTAAGQARLGELRLAEQPIEAVTSEKLVGVHHRYRANVAKDVQHDRADKAVDTAGRIRRIPGPTQVKANMAASTSVSQGGFGQAWGAPTQKDIDRCRSAITAATWDDRGAQRAVEVFFTVVLDGSKVDFAQAYDIVQAGPPCPQQEPSAP